jgi:hypothetical protein
MSAEGAVILGLGARMASLGAVLDSTPSTKRLTAAGKMVPKEGLEPSLPSRGTGF